MEPSGSKSLPSKKRDGEISLIPDTSTLIGAGDYLVVIGESSDITKLSTIISGR
jgi:K+/H+ antiporter YhaU regulatory subunit KhtT